MTKIMGIVNVTPDSFSDGGRFFDPDKAIAHARSLITEGADIIDVGGESTRPGSVPISQHEEQARIIPVISALKDCGVPISVDTRNADTMRAALDAGATIINDISALTHDPGSMKIAASASGLVCLMHTQGTPETMQLNPHYANVVEDIFAYLAARIAACEDAGISKSRLVADPGFGFGKNQDHNLALLNNFERFTDLGVTLLAGVSRKKFIGAFVNDAPPEGRIEASVAVALLLAKKGAGILRVHDVAATKAALNNLHNI